MTEFSIYQINVDRDTANVCFIGMESLEKIKGTKEVNAAAYDRVYDGKMDCISLENIYQKFNVDHPADYKGRSLSVSDVVEIRESDTLNAGFYFVDSIGFKSISFDKSLCKEPVEASIGKISVLLVEPNKYPKMIEIDDTLEAMQEVVGGDIEEYMPFEDEVAIICNEEQQSEKEKKRYCIDRSIRPGGKIAAFLPAPFQSRSFRDIISLHEKNEDTGRRKNAVAGRSPG